MPLSGKKLKKLAKKAGWVEDHVTGSHHIMKKDGFPAVSIPIHGNRDLPGGLEQALKKQLGIE
jgi:predicted RNA binding protein YcfA (HicA-like mRNA interferase family)